MTSTIDFYNPETFPNILGNWNEEFDNKLRRELKGIDDSNDIDLYFGDLKLKNLAIVRDFLKNNLDAEIVVCHCTRIFDEEKIWEEGLITGGGRGSAQEKRLDLLFDEQGFEKWQKERIFKSIYKTWNDIAEIRTKPVHFFATNILEWAEKKFGAYAENIGGEIVNAAICSISPDAYKQEPYKRLWIIGKPCVIKFKVKLSDIYENHREGLIEEIVRYFICLKILKKQYEIMFTGMTVNSIQPKNIISIEEIKNFIEIQERFPEFRGFYDELKQ